jgi:hypothetical protein
MSIDIDATVEFNRDAAVLDVAREIESNWCSCPERVRRADRCQMCRLVDFLRGPYREAVAKKRQALEPLTNESPFIPGRGAPCSEGER